MAFGFPTIGQWFRRPNGTLLEVVAVDEAEGTVEIQLFDGTIDEVEVESWRDQLLIEVAAPEDWSGSVDIEGDEGSQNGEPSMPSGFHDPLEFLKED